MKTKLTSTKRKAPSPHINDVIGALRRLATKKTLDSMARYGIPSQNAIGVAVGDMKRLAKQLGPNHELAADLWKTGLYEARMLATFIDDPVQVTSQQMDQWCRDFDSWAICDTACFALFDQSPHAWKMVSKWAGRKEEFQKRAAFALLACLAGHDKHADDESFAKYLPLIERAATDDRNFVKKGVSWALRGIGRRSRPLHSAVASLSTRLAKSDQPSARWIGKDVLKDINRPMVTKRFK